MKTCACGQPKGDDDETCRTCWHAAPVELRRDYMSTFSPGHKRELARKLVAFPRSRRPKAVPQPKQLELLPV